MNLFSCASLSTLVSLCTSLALVESQLVAPAPAPAPAAWPEPDNGDDAEGPSMTEIVMRRGIDEMAIAHGAMRQARESAKYAETTRQELVTHQAIGTAEDAHNKIVSLVPEARAEALNVRKYNFLAAQHRDHIKQVGEEFRHIADDAAQQARKAVIGWISAEAVEAAEHSTTIDKRGDRLANGVAAAAEPYHLAVLRNQKFCEETYAKAKTAMSSSQKLVGDAKALALKAQTLQATGLVVDAQQSMRVASDMMLQSEDLRKWANKLYHQSNTACSTVTGYTMAEQQAATNAAVTTAINAPMKLPKAT